MKVLGTIGQCRGAQRGVFQYKRTAKEVVIDSSIGTATLTPPRVSITTDEWSKILTAIENAPQESFRLTAGQPNIGPPNQSLHSLIPAAVQSPNGGWRWNDSWLAYVCAILEHEGSIEFYGGVLGTDFVCIPLRRDLP